MIWYPYTQMKTMKAPYKIVDAEGVFLYTKDKKLIDSISSWWCVIHGYRNPTITKAIKEQADKFSHVMLGGLTHDPVQKLSEKLEECLPGDLDYCFFSDSGSVAVEVALKMAFQYHMNKCDDKYATKKIATSDTNHVNNFNNDENCNSNGKSRTKILSLKHSYHGDTFKTMEAGNDEDYHFILEYCGRGNSVIHIPAEIQALESAFEKFHNEISSFIVEPLLQCAGGMRIYDISFLKRARELCDKYDVVLIFDEVATGFGRTGYRFVSDIVLPDILVLGKALTGGHIGHAVTVANHKIYDEFYSDDPQKALMHGPTFMGNPLACAASLASIELFERDDYLSKIKRIEEISKNELSDLNDPRIKEIRIIGGCACIEVHDPKDIEGFQEFAYDRGVFSRPFLKYIYSMVPYIIIDDELCTVFRVMKDWFKKKP